MGDRIDTADIKREARSPHGVAIARSTVLALCDEIDRLRADLFAVVVWVEGAPHHNGCEAQWRPSAIDSDACTCGRDEVMGDG